MRRVVPGEFYTDNETSLINESFNQSDVYFSIYNPSTKNWTLASPIAQQEGSEGKIVIGEWINNQLMTAWINYNNGESTIYWSTLTYDNNSGVGSWTDPEILYTDANPDPLTELSIVTINGKPTVLWTETQATSYSQLTQEESPLLYYRLAESSGTTLVNEGIYGAGGNGTYSGSVTFDEVGALENTSTDEGDPNPAVLFNSGNSATSSTIPLSGNSFSVEFWFKAPSLSSSSIELLSISGLLTISLKNTGLSYNLNGETLNSDGFTPTANEWYYVVASYDGEIDTATLYINGEPSATQENLALTLPSSATVTLASASNTSAVYLDEVAVYRQALTYSETGDISDFGNLTPSQISQLLFNVNPIGNKYNSQYIAPLPSGPNTNYVTYDGDSWSVPSVIEPTYKPIATQLSDANNPEWDVASFTSANSSGYVNPNGVADTYLPLNLSLLQTGTKITSIEVTAINSSNETITWSVGNTNGYQLAVVQGNKLLNPVNPNGSFEYTILSSSTDLSLYIDTGGDDSFSNFQYSLNGGAFQPLDSKDTDSATTTDNSNQVLGVATVTEANDSSLSLIDSGFIINTNNPSMGYSIVSADFNNDGKSDVAVGNRGYSNTSGTVLGQGTIQILFGGGAVLSNSESNPLTTTDLSGNPDGVFITGLSDTGQANGDYPISMATGDVNGDGYEDLVIGDPNANKVYVIYGSDNLQGTTINVNSLTSSQGYVINAPTSTNMAFGYSVAVGNFNSNAQSNGTYASGTKFDIAIGDPGANDGNGAVYVAFDGASSVSTTVYNSDNEGELAGYSLAVSSRTSSATTFTGNQNSDDLIIGAIDYEATVTNQWNGLSGLPSSSNSTQQPGGQPYPSTSKVQLGAVYVYKSDGTENLTEYISYTGPNLPSSNGTANNINAGSALSSSDLDGDGINDLAISAPGGANNNGVIYVLKGGVSSNNSPQNLSNVANLGIVGGLSFSQTGAVITSVGDMNNDKHEDFLITAPQGANGTGQGYVLFGPLNLSEIGTIFDLNVTANDSKTTFLLNGSQPYQLVGAGASGIGDVNGDGVDDLMISAPNAGQLYTIFGHPWLMDDGSIKLANISANNGFVIDGDLYIVDAETQIYQIPNQTANSAPSLINYNGTLYLAYKGDDNNQIYLTTSSNNGVTWSSAIELPSGMTTNVSPSIAFYNNVLYLAYQGLNNELNITYSTNNGQSWSSQYTVDQYSAAGFSLVEYDGELMVFFVSTESDNDILYITSNNPQSSGSWSEDYSVSNPPNISGTQQASDMISATVLNNTLYLAYRGGTVGSPNDYYVTSSSGTTLSDLTWQVSEISNANNPNTAPGLTNDGSQLYFTYGNTSEDIYVITSVNGTNWSTSQQVTNQTTNYTPSATVLNGQLYLGYAGTDQNQTLNITALEGSIPLVGNGNNVVVLGDVNGDGFADVLSGGSANGGILIFGSSTTNLIDAAAGTDDIVITVSNQTIKTFVGLGDINGDGLQDLGVIDNNNNFYVQLGSRNLPTLGSSIELSNVLESSISSGVALGDYNGDGYSDVMLTKTNNETYIYFGDSQGNFSSSVNVGSGIYTPIGDINGDGYSDFSSQSQSTSTETSTSIGYSDGFNNLEIYYGNAGKTLSAQAFLNSSDAPFYGTNTGKVVNQAGDFNGDGIPDMMLSTAQPVGLMVVETSNSAISFAYFNHLAIDWDSDTSVTLDVQTTTHTYSTSDETMGLASYNNDWFFAHSEDYLYWLSGSNISQDGENQFGSEYDYAKPQLVTANGNLYMIVAGWNSNNPYISVYNSSNNSWQSVDSSTEEDSLTNPMTNTNGNDVVSAAIGSNIYIAWTHNNDLYYGYWNTNNSTYTQLNNISLSSIISGNAGDNDPLSMTVLNGTLYLALRDGNNNAWMTTYDTNNSSPSWSSSNKMMYLQGNKQIEAEENSVTLTTLNGEVYATWYDVNEIVTDSQNVYLIKYNDSSSSWTNSLLLNDGTTPLDITGNGDFPGLTPFVWSAQTSVILGNTSQNASSSIEINGITGNFSEATATTDPTQSPYSSLGNEITFIGDINGDGFDDILLSVPNYNNNEGGTFVVFGTDSNEPIDLQNLTADENNTGNKSSTQGFAIEGLPSSLAGISISGGADVNGDGFEDLVIGAPGDNDNLTYVIFGSDFNNTVNQTGTIGADVMIGTATGESFIGGEGDDQIFTNGGIDVVYAGLGNDFVTVNDTYFRRLDGGAGTDVLRFEGYNGQDWDLTTLSPGSRLRNFEILVTENYGANTLTLNSLTVTQLSPDNTVTVVMDVNDTLNLSADFSLNGTVYQYNQKFDRYTSNISGATVLLNRIVGTETETSQLILTEEGSLVLLSSSGEQLWTAEKNGVQVTGAVQALMQTDGNFVLYSQVQPTNQPGSAEFALWASGTNNNDSGTYLQLGGDGGLYIKNSSGQTLSTLNSGNANISNPSRLNEQQELLSSDSLSATLTETVNSIDVTKNAPSTNTPTSNSTAEVASLSTTTSYSVDESGNETAQSVASSMFSATASNPNAPTRISVTNPTANEADGEVEFTIQRTGDLDKYVQVHYITQDGRAKAGSNYNPVLGRVVFKPGETTKTVSVPLILDDVYTGTRDLGLLVTLEKESDTLLSDEFNLYIDSSNGQIRNWDHIIGEQPNSVMGGELEFRVTTTDGKAEVKVYFEGNKDFNNYYIFNNQTQLYQPFSGAQFFDEDDDGKNEGVILNLQDGSEYDIDGSQNSIIFKRGFFADGEPPEVILDTAMYRFRSLDTEGAYLYVDAKEKESVLTNYGNNFVEEGLAFYVSDTQEDGLIAFNRFRNSDVMGGYIYAGETESESIRSNYPQFIEEGIAFYAYGAGSQMTDSITRFQNSMGGAYLYTAQPETQSVITNYSNSFNLEGIAFEALLA